MLKRGVARRTVDYVNFLLVFVPIGIVAGKLEWSPTAVFTLNFLAIIPLAAVLSFATEEISVRLGDALGGLLNATFGNAVELIVRLSLYLSSGPSARFLASTAIRVQRMEALGGRSCWVSR